MAKWIIDSLHSDIHFKARYLLISSVTGEFKKFEGTVETSGNDFTNAKIIFSADTASIDTNNEKRDAHLKEEDFFNVAKHPKMEFEATAFYPAGEDEHILAGKLTVKSGSKPIQLKVVPGGIGIDPEGKERAGFEITGSINRYDFGLVWGLLSESGALLLGEEVRIVANIQLVKVSE